MIFRDKHSLLERRARFHRGELARARKLYTHTTSAVQDVLRDIERIARSIGDTAESHMTSLAQVIGLPTDFDVVEALADISPQDGGLFVLGEDRLRTNAITVELGCEHDSGTSSGCTRGHTLGDFYKSVTGASVGLCRNTACPDWSGAIEAPDPISKAGGYECDDPDKVKYEGAISYKAVGIAKDKTYTTYVVEKNIVCGDGLTDWEMIEGTRHTERDNNYAFDSNSVVYELELQPRSSSPNYHLLVGLKYDGKPATGEDRVPPPPPILEDAYPYEGSGTIKVELALPEVPDFREVAIYIWTAGDSIQSDPVVIQRTSDTEVVIDGLTNGVEYRLQAKAIDDSGNVSVWSNELRVTPNNDGERTTLPAPEGLTARTDTQHPTEIRLGWSAVDGAARYHVYRRFEYSTVKERIATTSSAETYYVDTPTRYVTYCYSVSAVTDDGQEGTLSEEVCASTYSGSAGADHIVDMAGSGDFLDIQDALDSSSVKDGDVIYIMPGPQLEDGSFTPYRENLRTTKQVTLRGQDMNTVRVEPPSHEIPALDADEELSRSITVEDITFVSQTDGEGIGISGGKVILTRVGVVGFSIGVKTYGHVIADTLGAANCEIGLWLTTGGSTIVDSVVNDSAFMQCDSAIFQEESASTLSVNRCTFDRNQIHVVAKERLWTSRCYFGGAGYMCMVLDCNTDVLNSIVINPNGFYASKALRIENVVMDGINASGIGVVMLDRAVRVKNCVVMNYNAGLQCNQAANNRVEYSCFYANISNTINASLGIGCFIADPKFEGGDPYSYALDEDSPCIDTGDPTMQDTDGSPCDIGAYGGPNAGAIGWDEDIGPHYREWSAKYRGTSTDPSLEGTRSLDPPARYNDDPERRFVRVVGYGSFSGDDRNRRVLVDTVELKSNLTYYDADLGICVLDDGDGCAASPTSAEIQSNSGVGTEGYWTSCGCKGARLDTYTQGATTCPWKQTLVDQNTIVVAVENMGWGEARISRLLLVEQVDVIYRTSPKIPYYLTCKGNTIHTDDLGEGSDLPCNIFAVIRDNNLLPVRAEVATYGTQDPVYPGVPECMGYLDNCVVIRYNGPELPEQVELLAPGNQVNRATASLLTVCGRHFKRYHPGRDICEVISTTYCCPDAYLTISYSPSPARAGQSMSISYTVTDYYSSPKWKRVIDFGDGTNDTSELSGTSESVTHTYSSAGIYDVVITLTDTELGNCVYQDSIRVLVIE